jgi:hypothetical protein
MTGSMNKWRFAFFVTLAVALPAIGFLVYAVIDQAVTLTYMSDGYGRTEKDLKTLAQAFPRDRYKKRDIVAVLRRIDPQGLIIEKTVRSS